MVLGPARTNYTGPCRSPVLAIVEKFSGGAGGTSPSPEGWPAPAPRDSELGVPLQFD